jgi:hypothetical protein
MREIKNGIKWVDISFSLFWVESSGNLLQLLSIGGAKTQQK